MKKYLEEMLKLSGLTEAYFDPKNIKEWDSEIRTIQSTIQGEITHLVNALEAIRGSTFEFKQHETSLEDYSLDLIKHLNVLKNKFDDYIVRNKHVEQGSKADYAFKSINVMKKILIIFHDLISKKNQILNSGNVAARLKEFYLHQIQPLITFNQQQLDAAYLSSRLI